MNEKRKRLRELQEQKQRKAHLDALRSELAKQQRELSDKTISLKAAMVNEQADVDRLERGGLVSMFYELLGSKEKKLEQERREAHDARLNYESALREQADVEYRLNRVDGELAELSDSSAEYDALLTELVETVTDREAKREIEVLSHRVHSIQAAKNEIHPILEEIDRVREHLIEAQKSLQFTDEGEKITRYEELRDARRLMNEIEERLAALKPVLYGIGVETSITYYAKLLSNYNDEMVGGVGLLQMIKHVHGQNNGTRAALEQISEQLNDTQRKTERELNDRIMILLQ